MQNSSTRLDFNHHASPWNYILRVNLDNIEILSQQNACKSSNHHAPLDPRH